MHKLSGWCTRTTGVKRLNIYIYTYSLVQQEEQKGPDKRQVQYPRVWWLYPSMFSWYEMLSQLFFEEWWETSNDILGRYQRAIPWGSKEFTPACNLNHRSHAMKSKRDCLAMSCQAVASVAAEQTETAARGNLKGDSFLSFSHAGDFTVFVCQVMLKPFCSRTPLFAASRI